jgi:plastocyanin
MRKRLSFVCALAFLLALAACGKSEENAVPPAAGPNATGGGTPAPAATGTLSGKIAFEGTAPVNAKIQMAADPYCAKNSKDPMTEDFEVKDGGLQNVIVYVSSPVTGSFPTPTDAVTIDQHDCHYVPHVFTLMVGQKLSIKNSDETLHNIHAFADVNEQFNVGQAVKGMTNDHVFTKAEMPLPFKCDVHKWMSAFAGVFTHPYETVSKEGGAYEIKLPPGNYEITAWHEKLGPQKQNIEVKEGSNTLNFTFKPAPASAD